MPLYSSTRRHELTANFARRILTAVALIVCVSCSDDGPTFPAAPSQAAPLSVSSLRVTPTGVGVLFNTDFAFEAVGAFPGATQFVWQFGDGSTTTTSVPTTNRLYGAPGSFGVTVEARSGAGSAAGAAQVTVRSLVGRWRGTVTGHTVVPRARPIPITSFDLTINDAPRPATASGSVVLSAAWADDAGCRRDRNILQSFAPRASADVRLSIESLQCSDGDFSMQGTSNANLDRVEGTCSNAGPNCRFVMVRQ